VYASAALGYRAMLVSADGSLAGPHTRTRWYSGPNRAYCNKMGDHFPPGPDCRCGWYAFRQPDAAEAKAFPLSDAGWRVVVALIAARGRTMLYSDGFRAEEAVILAIAPLHGAQPDLLEFARTAADRYDIPLCDSVGALYRLSERLDNARPAPAADAPVQPGPSTPPPAVRARDRHLVPQSSLQVSARDARHVVGGAIVMSLVVSACLTFVFSGGPPAARNIHAAPAPSRLVTVRRPAHPASQSHAKTGFAD
jgi:hypothetical protein